MEPLTHKPVGGTLAEAHTEVMAAPAAVAAREAVAAMEAAEATAVPEVGDRMAATGRTVAMAPAVEL